MNPLADRRKNKRFETELFSDYAVTRTFWPAEGKGIIRNISNGGIRFDAYEKISRWGRLVIEMSVDNFNINVVVTGNIVWKQHIDDVVSYGVKLNWFSDKTQYDNYMNILAGADIVY